MDPGRRWRHRWRPGSCKAVKRTQRARSGEILTAASCDRSQRRTAAANKREMAKGTGNKRNIAREGAYIRPERFKKGLNRGS